MKEYDIDETAARWTARRQSGRWSEADARAYAEWLEGNAEAKAAVARYEQTLGIADIAAVDALAEEFERELEQAYAEQRSGVSRRYAAIAAGAALVVAAGAAFYLASPSPARTSIYASEVGERRNITFADGSTAVLNTDSALSVTYTKHRRSLSLTRGEALFDVARDPARPFVVATERATVEVTGTVFSVRSAAGETGVLVVSGAVTVMRPEDSGITLTAGQKLRIDDAGVELAEADPELALAWRDGRARYRARPLGEVVADLNRYFTTPIELADASLADELVTAEFNLADQSTVVRALTVAFGLQSSADTERILLSRQQ